MPKDPNTLPYLHRNPAIWLLIKMFFDQYVKKEITEEKFIEEL